jgi:hypothetical protein
MKNIPIPSGHDIYWEPWVDAYDNEEVNAAKKFLEENMSELSEIEEELLDAAEEDMENLSMYSQPIQTIITPFGVLPLTETSLASNHFKFWVGHSNFKLMEDYYPIIESCKGVESVDILTPYRFRIAIAKLFQDRDVMHEVRKTLLGAVNES